MKKLILALSIVFISTTLIAQEKGLYITAGGNVGRTNFSYKLEGGTPKADLGFGASVGAQYYFNKYLGLSLSADLSIYNTNSYFNERTFTFPGILDNEGDINTILVDFEKWTETQRTYFFDIPLLMRFQYKWGKKEMHGFYLGFGVKLSAPVASTYQSASGNVGISAHLRPDEGGPNLDTLHGYGQIDLLWSGKNQLKVGFGIVGEVGFLIGLGRRVDLTLGISADYGFLNIKKSSTDLLEIATDKTPQDGAIGEILTYNGILNSNKTNLIHPSSIRANVGLRIKLGKLSDRTTDDEFDNQTKRMAEILEQLGRRERDTIIVNPVVVPVYMPNPNGNGQTGGENGTGVGYENGYGNGAGYGYGDDEAGYGSDGGTTPRKRRGVPVPQPVIDELEESIYFDLDKYNLDQEAIEVLDRKVAQMKKYPYASVSIVGHTCDLGSASHNDELSRNRAMAARYYMIRKGIKPARIEVIPMGIFYPSHPNDTEDHRRLNRRVDFIFND